MNNYFIRIRDARPVDIILFACVGGHLDQLLSLHDSHASYTFTYVVDDFPADRDVLRNRTIKITHARRKPFLIIANIVEIILILIKTRPKVIISTGAGPAVWFFYFGKLFGAKLVFIESMARVETHSLTGRIVLPISDRFYVQWPSLASKKAKYKGALR